MIKLKLKKKIQNKMMNIHVFKIKILIMGALAILQIQKRKI